MSVCSLLRASRSVKAAAGGVPGAPDHESRPGARRKVLLAGVLSAGVLSATSACATYGIFSDCLGPSPACLVEGSDDEEAVLFLVGDAGFMEFDRHPVMEQMRVAVAALDARGVPTTVLFLGDNVYDEGVRDDRPEDLRRLRAQVEVLEGTSAKGIFLAGNHDWANTAKEEGLGRILSQDRALRTLGDETGASVGLMPPGGCPGPERWDLEGQPGDRVATLLLLDTAWWMLEPPPDTRCSPSTKEDVIRELERGISDAPEGPVIVAAHHPLRPGGPHGGNAGSLRWLANRAGLVRADLNTPRYQDFIEAVSGVLARVARPVIYAAGHEHALQVIDESVGSASVLHLDFGPGGRIRLDVVAECSAEAVEAMLCPADEEGRFRRVYRARVR